jgi:hypothetical protein
LKGSSGGALDCFFKIFEKELVAHGCEELFQYRVLLCVEKLVLVLKGHLHLFTVARVVLGSGARKTNPYCVSKKTF